MSDLIPYGEQFEKIVNIIESAKERAYQKVNEELILMYRDIGEYISLQSENAEYGDAFVQKLADFFATKYPELKGFNRRGLYRMKQFYELYKDNKKVSTLLTQLNWLKLFLMRNKTGMVIPLDHRKNCDSEGFFCFHVIKEHQNSVKILCLCVDNVFTILQVEHCNMRLMACKTPEIFCIKPNMRLWWQL